MARRFLHPAAVPSRKSTTSVRTLLYMLVAIIFVTFLVHVNSSLREGESKRWGEVSKGKGDGGDVDGGNGSGGSGTIDVGSLSGNVANDVRSRAIDLSAILKPADFATAGTQDTKVKGSGNAFKKGEGTDEKGKDGDARSQSAAIVASEKEAAAAAAAKVGLSGSASKGSISKANEIAPVLPDMNPKYASGRYVNFAPHPAPSRARRREVRY